MRVPPLQITILFFLQQHLKAVFEEALDKETVVKDMSGRVVKISSATLQTLEHIVKVLTYLYKDDLKYVTDYRMAVVKATVYTRNPNTVSNIKYMYLLYIICVHQVFCINFYSFTFICKFYQLIFFSLDLCFKMGLQLYRFILVGWYVAKFEKKKRR